MVWQDLKTPEGKKFIHASCELFHCEGILLLKRCDSTMTKWARRGYLVPSMVGGKHLYRKADVMRILNGGRK